MFCEKVQVNNGFLGAKLYLKENNKNCSLRHRLNKLHNLLYGKISLKGNDKI